MKHIDKITLRKILRNKRQKIPLAQRLTFSTQIATQFISSEFFHPSLHIAGYLAADGEVDLVALQANILAANKKYYLPLLHPEGHSRLFFSEYKEGDPLIANRYKILEPLLIPEKLIAPKYLDVVLVPLVGFDERGNRLGMGKGFYDQTFEFLQQTRRHKPCLLGIAYEAQKIDHFQVNEWDIPLQAIITEEKIYQIT